MAMNNIDVANGLIFNALQIKSKDTFEDRLICQKKIYLLQQLGTDLGYGYNWYLKGPYSPALTNYIYGNLDILTKYDYSQYSLTEDVKGNIELINGLSERKPDDLTESSWYELIASVLYIMRNHASWKISNELEAVFGALIKHKPQYDKRQFQVAVDVLKENKFIMESCVSS